MNEPVIFFRSAALRAALLKNIGFYLIHHPKSDFFERRAAPVAQKN
jgi:hypothetical protein